MKITPAKQKSQWQNVLQSWEIKNKMVDPLSTDQNLSPADQIFKKISKIYEEAIQQKEHQRKSSNNYKLLSELAVSADELKVSFEILKAPDYPDEDKDVYIRWFNVTLASIQDEQLPHQIKMLKTMSSVINKSIS